MQSQPAANPGALCLHDGDDVAVMRDVGTAGALCQIVTTRDRFELRLATDVPFGHKVALRPIPAGTMVRKYGQSIGTATQDIAAGAHVHTHNLAGLHAPAAEVR